MYKEAYGYSDYDIAQLDPDIYSDEVMELINDMIQRKADDNNIDEDEEEFYTGDIPFETLSNDDFLKAQQEIAHMKEINNRKRYAGGALSREDICPNGVPQDNLNGTIAKVYADIRASMEKDYDHFTVRDGSLCGLNGEVYICRYDESKAAKMLVNAAKHEPSTVYADQSVTEQDVKELGTYEIRPAFYKFLSSLPDWHDIADGRFESAMAREMLNDTL